MVSNPIGRSLVNKGNERKRKGKNAMWLSLSDVNGETRLICTFSVWLVGVGMDAPVIHLVVMKDPRDGTLGSHLLKQGKHAIHYLNLLHIS
jgi:hypothetical protein